MPETGLLHILRCDTNRYVTSSHAVSESLIRANGQLLGAPKESIQVNLSRICWCPDAKPTHEISRRLLRPYF